MKHKGFRQIDNQFFLAIMAADLTRSGSKVLLAVIHFTLGYNQRDTADISLSTFQNLTKLSRPAVRTAIKELIAYGLISEVGSATNRLSAIYKLNVAWRGKADLPSGGKADLPSNDKKDKNELSKTPKTLPPDVQNFTSRGKVATRTTGTLKKERKLLKKTNNAPSGAGWGALSRKLKNVISYYLKAYREHTGKPHPNLRPEQWDRVGAELEAFRAEYGVSDFPAFQTIIDYHFQRRLKTDYNINHFATPGVLENLFYKNLY